MEFLKKLVIVLSVALMLGLTCLLLLLLYDPTVEGDDNVWVIMFFVVFLLVCILVAICVWALMISHRYTERNRILNKQLVHEGTMYTKTSELYERTRKLNHDLKAYLLVLLGYIENSDYEQARLHLVDILEQKLNLDLVHYETSREINAVLNDKVGRAKSQSVALDMCVSGEVAAADAMDVAIILSNLLDNALEAAAKSEKKTVKLDMYERKGMYYIHVSNSVDASVLKKNPQLNTTKAEKKKHGIGLRSVKQLVKHLDGSFRMFEEQGFFHSSVAFPIDRG